MKNEIFNQRESFNFLQPFLVDPIDYSVLEAEFNGDYVEVLKSKSGAIYKQTPSFLQLMVKKDFAEMHYGKENHRKWELLQSEAEKSYKVREKGHFSVDSYTPSIRFGEVLSDFSPKFCLDVGCGKLKKPVYMKASKSTQFVGIDPMDIVTERSFPFVRAAAGFLPFKAKSFDCVMFPSSLDHVINPKRALEEAHRILKKGGTLLIVETIRTGVSGFDSWRRKAAFCPLKVSRFNKHHNWAFNEKLLIGCVKDSGFEVKSFNMIHESSEGLVIAGKI
jgi:ubiquinone/menaquinone biosynthesis C-methylase UbiE